MIEKHFRAIIDNSPESIVLIGLNHQVLAFNKTIKDVLFQYHKREIKVGDLYFPDFVIESNHEIYLEAFNKAINGKPYYALNFTKNENASIWFEYNMLPVYEGNELLGVTLSAKDISAEKEAELKITDLSEKLSAILDNTDESITLVDLNCKIMALNQIALTTIENNTNQSEIKGRDFRDFIPDKNNLFYEYFPKAAKGESALVEINYQNVSGDWIWYQTKFNPVYDNHKKQIGVSIFAKDITEKKKLEQALYDSEERFRKITAIAPIGILTTNTNFEIQYANLCATQMFGYTEYEIYSQSITQIIQNFKISDAHKLRVDDLNIDIETPIFNQEQFVAITKNKETINILLSSSLFNNQKELNYIFIIQDISELSHKDNIIADQYNKLRDIAWYQSHIIRAPLARIKGLAALLDDNTTDQKEKEYVYKTLLKSANELDKVIHDIAHKTTD